MHKTRLDQSVLLALIDSTYAAAEDARLWEPLLVALADAVGGTSACLISHDLIASGSTVVAAGLDPEALALYNQHYHAVDPWALAGRRLWIGGDGHPTVSDEAILPRAAFRKTEFYPFVLRHDIPRMMHATLQQHPQGSDGLSVYRRENDRPFDDREVAFLKELAPHLGRALRLFNTLARGQQERSLAFDGLDAVPIGVLFVTGQGRIVHANRAAAAILAQRDGLFTDDSVLRTASPGTTASLQGHCAECARTANGGGLGAGGALRLPRPSGRRDLKVLVSPVKRVHPFGLHHGRVAAIVFVTDPEGAPLPPAAALRTLYGLTAAESEMAVRLASDCSVAEISDACGYTVQTVRWYSKQILAKVGCRNRAALVRELSRLTLAFEVTPGQ